MPTRQSNQPPHTCWDVERITNTNQGTIKSQSRESGPSPDASFVTAQETDTSSSGSQLEGDSVNQGDDQHDESITDLGQASVSEGTANIARSSKRPKKKSDFMRKATTAIDGLYGRLELYIYADATSPGRMEDLAEWRDAHCPNLARMFAKHGLRFGMAALGA